MFRLVSWSGLNDQTYTIKSECRWTNEKRARAGTCFNSFGVYLDEDVELEEDKNDNEEDNKDEVDDINPI